ncbi:MAG: endonuclease MutS2 [Lachnospiraceae bacterium]|nr:endonuclease MutS2 [Lachnospiraceae bacterium]
MNKKALHTLEYDKIIPLLKSHASSAPGKKLCEMLTPSDCVSQIELRLKQTDDAVSYLLKTPSYPSFGNNRDFSLELSRLKMGAHLNTSELLSMASFLENVARIKGYARDLHKGRDTGYPDQVTTEAEDNEDDDCLKPFFEELAPMSDKSSEIRRCILSEEQIADDATPALYSLHKKRASLEDKIHSHLLSMVNGSARTYLQDPVITQKNGRYCLPVKSEHKGDVPGIVHERSSSGFTLFIEPAAIAEFNNKISQLISEEEDEIEKLLYSLSSLLGEDLPALQRNCEIMTILDFVFAKGMLALDMKASCPVIKEDAPFCLKRARHPLLDPSRAVPVDIRLDEGIRQLIITGPNTGGKTVSLKTAGLLCLMAQAGLFIPASDNSTLPVFNEIFADIGDEQSIEQNLSTFSSHMTNISTILQKADSATLVLLDELCSGTDPEEGAALAISILETLAKKDALTLVTTHYSEIKLYALKTKHVVNASCEFDLNTLSPTYRLLTGIPGKSNAFAIAGRLGIKTAVIDRAKELLSHDHDSFEDVISDLEEKRIKMESDELAISESRAEADKLLKRLQSSDAEILQKKEKILQEANEEAARILKEAKQMADETIRDLRTLPESASIRELEKRRTQLREEINRKNENALKSDKVITGSKNKALTPESVPATKENIKVGLPVRINSMNLEGIVQSLPDSKGFLFVQCGIINTKAALSDLDILPARREDSSKSNKASSYSKLGRQKSSFVKTEINLLGKTADEAISELDKYLDDAYIAHLPMVRIVHGKGSGILRNAVQRHLKRLSYVKEFRAGEFGEGDSGVTIVTFK